MYTPPATRKDKLESDNPKYSPSSGPNTTPRFIAAYLRLNTSSLFDGGVISDNNALDVGSNNARQMPLSAFMIKNSQIWSDRANPINTSAQPNTDMNNTFLRPIRSEMYPHRNWQNTDERAHGHDYACLSWRSPICCVK